LRPKLFQAATGPEVQILKQTGWLLWIAIVFQIRFISRHANEIDAIDSVPYLFGSLQEVLFAFGIRECFVEEFLPNG
jgi:hypothetical protein